MAYLLTADRADPVNGVSAFERYQAYLRNVREVMPIGAYSLATSAWWFDPRDHRCPHDGWLEALNLEELPNAATEVRRLRMQVRLLGAYQDGHLLLHYQDVGPYSLSSYPTSNAKTFRHRDWRHDEFRVTAEGRVEHEIEWWGPYQTARWLIEAGEITAEWVPVPA
jgi:hypothetical protein